MEDLVPFFAANSLAPHTHIHGYKMSKVSFTGSYCRKTDIDSLERKACWRAAGGGTL